MKLYIASRTRHAPKWIALRTSLREQGIKVISTWLDSFSVEEGQSVLSALWTRCIAEASSADALLLYCEQAEVLKGALVEVGAALAHGRPVYFVFVGDSTVHASWVHHPNVHKCQDLEDAIRCLKTHQNVPHCRCGSTWGNGWCTNCDSHAGP